MEIGWLDTPEEWRDFFLMFFTVAGFFAFLAIFMFTVVTGWLSVTTLLRVRRVLSENLAPTLDSVRETSESVRGTVGFISDHAVKPVIKVYGTAAGARRFVAVMTRITRPKREG